MSIKFSDGPWSVIQNDHMTSPVQEHEKLFDDICNKLNELSTRTEGEGEVIGQPMDTAQPRYEKMQVQMKKFNTELMESQEEFKEKIKTLENVSYGPETLDAQLRQLSEHLMSERANSTKLSADLAKSLELCLQLQLEIQGLKARTLQAQSEEKKYSNALLEKTRVLQRDLELNQALKDETAMELQKAKAAFNKEHGLWEEQREKFEGEIHSLKTERAELEQTISDMEAMIEERNETITSLHQEIEKISSSYNEVETSAQQQHDVLKNLMGVAESKIVEMKLALDKKALEAQDYYSHLQQALTQAVVHKQENTALKEYVTKLNYYHQQASQAQMAVAQMAQAGAAQVQNT
ncbi:Chromosome partition protein Smc [compost metagenome]